MTADRRLAGLPLLLTLAACGRVPSEEPAGGRVVAGITSDFVPGPQITRLEATTSVDGRAQPPRTWSINAGEPIAFPFELPFEDVPDGADIDLRMSAFDLGSAMDTPFLVRHAATSAIAGKDLLLRVHLEWECVPSFQLGSNLLAPICSEPDTCVAAECVDPYVPPSDLEAYTPAWAVDYADACRPLDAGPPELAVGQGFDEFAALAPGDDVPMEPGDQGGYHIWLALRMANLHRVGSITTLTATRKSTAEELCAIEVPWDFAPSGEGDCDLPGIRCVVAYSGADATLLVGEAVHLVAKVVDATGDVGFGEQDITLTPLP